MRYTEIILLSFDVLFLYEWTLEKAIVPFN